MTRRLVAAVVGGVLLLAAACSGDDTDGAAGDDATDAVEEVSADTDEPRRFEGDPDSPFCQASRASAERPLLDPFEAGLDADEVELRFRALDQRFGELADVAPDVLADDLELLDETFGELGEVLAAVDYDFERLAAEGEVDLAVFDDPTFDVVAQRLATYQTQVCAP